MSQLLSRNTTTLLVLLLIVISGISCARKDLIQPGDTLQEAFNKAMAQYQKENYREAASAFETVIRIGRGTDYGQEAQYFLAESYFNSDRFLLAAAEYERYSTLFPRSPKRPEADFKEALSYYNMSPRYRLDQKYTRRAIEKFRLYNSRYPQSDRVEEAAQYISEMRTKLAHKLYGAADLYMRTDRYEAAIIYYDLIIDRYPETAWAERALVDEINAYVTYAERSIQSKQRERYQQAIATYEKYLQLFPNGKNRSEAESYVDKARGALADLGPSNSSSTGSTSNR